MPDTVVLKAKKSPRLRGLGMASGWGMTTLAGRNLAAYEHHACDEGQQEGRKSDNHYG